MPFNCIESAKNMVVKTKRLCDHYITITKPNTIESDLPSKSGYGSANRIISGKIRLEDRNRGERHMFTITLFSKFSNFFHFHLWNRHFLTKINRKCQVFFHFSANLLKLKNWAPHVKGIRLLRYLIISENSIILLLFGSKIMKILAIFL